MLDKINVFQRGKEAYDKERYAEAIKHFSEAIEMDNTNADWYSTRAVAFFHNSDLPASLQDMNTAQSLEPKNPYRYSSRAYIRDAMGDIQGAIEDYQIAISLDPEDAVAHNNLGLLEEKLGHQSKANSLFALADKLAEDDPNFNISLEKPTNIQKETEAERKAQSLSGEMVKVFKSRKAFKEFLSFIGKGFKA